jgi:hypothetical protein
MRPDHEETRLTVTATTGATYVEVESTDGFQVGDDISILAYGQANVAHHTIVKIESGRIYLDTPIAVSGTYAPEGYGQRGELLSADSHGLGLRGSGNV